MITNEKTIWGLLGKNKGDNTQIEVLCHAFGEAFAVAPVFKTLLCQKRFVVPNVLRPAGLGILSNEDRAQLNSPLFGIWPDILISTGRKSVAVARWVQQQSGGKTRLVWIGRPKAPLSWFDLVVSTPQYGLPDTSNLFKLPLPLVPERRGGKARASWRDLPRPLIGVLVGGNNFPLLMDDKAIERLAARITDLQNEHGGTCLVVTSPRTGMAQGEKLKMLLPANVVFYLWQRGGENPYGDVLDNADRFLVTGDSVTMLAEASVTGKPVEVFSLKRSPWWPRWQAKSGVLAKAVAMGVLAPPRDVSLVHDRLDSEYNQAQMLAKIIERVGAL